MTRTSTSARSTTAWRALFRPLDASWLSAYRILFGVTLGVSMLRFLAYGWVDRFFVSPAYHFKYWGFEWVEPLPGPAMHALFVALAVCSFLVAAGLFFRVAAFVLAVGLAYFQLIDVTTYLNHYYLAALITFLLALSPAHRTWSLDAALRRRFGRPFARELPALWLYLFRFQVGVVYFFAGLAKAQSDWLIHAQPLRIWLGASTGLPVIGPLLTYPGVPLFLSWCGFLFDLTIVGWLLYGKTRPYAYGVVIAFHVMTRLLFPIGMFPFIMTLSALVFFSPSWPRRLFARFSARPLELPRWPAVVAAPSLWRKAGVAVLGLYCALQLVLPLRSRFYEGNVLWHEQGMRLSWRVMARAKGGHTTFVVRQKETGRIWHVSPRTYLNGLQESEMSSQPDLILQLAHHIRADFERRGLGPVEVRADSKVSFNGRRAARFIDPDVDLTAVRDGLRRRDWVLPAPSEPPHHTRPVL